MNNENIVKGYKVFNPDWTCRDKRYTCPGEFEETGELRVCGNGMHFCKKAADCFNYYKFDPRNHVAEVIACGAVLEEGDKCCTDKLKIVREIPWAEVLEIVNSGTGNSGNGNSGDGNSGNWNSGDRNSGNWNSGNGNSGDRNSGNWNSGNRNSGDRNSGNWNSGNRNSGDGNSGNGNSGDGNSGNGNSGDGNSGNWNNGNWNNGDRNSGDWNKTNFSNGCFNTIEPTINLFNKPSDWTYRDWRNSEARRLLFDIDYRILDWTSLEDMSEEEIKAHPEAKTTGGYLKKLDNSECAIIWWRGLSDEGKATIKAIPNFDPAIFKEITGIDVEENND